MSGISLKMLASVPLLGSRNFQAIATWHDKSLKAMSNHINKQNAEILEAVMLEKINTNLRYFNSQEVAN